MLHDPRTEENPQEKVGSKMTDEARWYFGINGGEKELRFLKTIDGLSRIESNKVIPDFEHNVKLFLAIPEKAEETKDVHSIEKLAKNFFLQVRGLFELREISIHRINLEYVGLFEKKEEFFQAQFPIHAHQVYISAGTCSKRLIEQVLTLRPSDKDVQDVLIILGNAPLRWFELYKVFEICTKGVTDEELSEMFGGKKARDRFTISANHQDSPAGLEARHARMNRELPKRPMHLDEARKFILTGVILWLRVKKKIVF